MTRAARGVALALLLAGASFSSPAAAAEPQPTGLELAESVEALGIAESIDGIDLAASIVPLRQERTQGSITTVQISADVLFAFGAADLTPAARGVIAGVAARLRGATGEVSVTGYTDSVGAPADNLRLSQQRAESVRAELARAAGGVQIKAVGRGEADPVQPNTKNGEDNPEGRAENRRVEISFSGR
ncbi:OmpA family protein [Actinomadura vinacea]|uniref:OmpA family protein n=1 Tax=Actinomadura vinacea TaxID=115336 RepID=A0ABP5VNK0_9ACTN